MLRRIGNMTVGEFLDINLAFGVVLIITLIGGPADNFVHTLGGSILLAGVWELLKMAVAATMLLLLATGKR